MKPRQRWSRVRLILMAALAAMPLACAGPPDAASPSTPMATDGIARLAAPFRDYQLGTRRPGGERCAEAAAPVASLRYVESLEYIDSPPVTFGMDGDCIREIRTDYAMSQGRFEHALSFASQRLGSPDGEDRVTCTETGEEIHAVYWNQPEGRFELIRMGFENESEFVLRSPNSPHTFARNCEGGVER